MVEPVLIEKKTNSRKYLPNQLFLYFSILFQSTAAIRLLTTGNKCKNPNKKPLHPDKNILQKIILHVQKSTIEILP